MRGQWLGRYSGATNSGAALLNLDDRGSYYQGAGYAFDDNSQNIPPMVILFRTQNKNTDVSLRDLEVIPFTDQHGDMPSDVARLRSLFPKLGLLPTTADVDLELRGQEIVLRWKTNIGTSAEGVLSLGKPDQPSEVEVLPIETWEEFKKYPWADADRYRFVFRGQSNSAWRLRTHFHRTGRTDLRRYTHEDINTLNQHASALTNHVYDFAKPLEYASFFNLVQHHGFPTPLLDWSYSPYVAAYFAFKYLDLSNLPKSEKVRIYTFDKSGWETNWNQIRRLEPARLHVSILEPLAIDNKRLSPQQALSTMTNVDDIETYIQSREKLKGQKYLTAVDLPVGERSRVLHDLSVMGITAGALFPGLDGLCEQMKDRFFPS